ncbi:MAG: 50S ribosomal protein L24e [Nitrososphaerales archaeon]|jgi:large subunit ribosomal protein L24e|nr:50S ribosomal protein L24e [Nitrososphaerota archaeon]
MLSLKTCSFCGGSVNLGEGTLLVRNDGSINWYCSSKCRKSSVFLKRDPRRFKWTTITRQAREKRKEKKKEKKKATRRDG